MLRPAERARGCRPNPRFGTEESVPLASSSQRAAKLPL
jgi:hypothetical protein